jgi:hypothetical protein
VCDVHMFIQISESGILQEAVNQLLVFSRS